MPNFLSLSNYFLLLLFWTFLFHVAFIKIILSFYPISFSILIMYVLFKSGFFNSFFLNFRLLDLFVFLHHFWIFIFDCLFYLACFMINLSLNFIHVVLFIAFCLFYLLFLSVSIMLIQKFLFLFFLICDESHPFYFIILFLFCHLFNDDRFPYLLFIAVTCFLILIISKGFILFLLKLVLNIHLSFILLFAFLFLITIVFLLYFLLSSVWFLIFSFI
jgi:hypothetical protein